MPNPQVAARMRHKRIAAQKKKEEKEAEKQESEVEIILRDTLPAVFVKAIEPSSHAASKKTSPRLNSISDPTKKASQGSSKNFVCKKCRRKTSTSCHDDDESGDEEGEPLSSDEEIVTEVDDTTMLVAHQLKKMKENRRKHEEQQKLNEVLDRVQAALDYSGIEFDDVYVPTFQNDMFNIEASKEKKKERTQINDMFDESARLGRDRDDVMQDVENWFAISTDELDNFCNLKPNVSSEELMNDDYFMRIHKAFRRSSSSVQKLIQVLQKKLFSDASSGGNTGAGNGGNKQNMSRYEKRKAFASRSRLNLTGRSQQQCNMVAECDSIDVGGGTETINENVTLNSGDAEMKSSQESLSTNQTNAAAAEHKIRNFTKKLYTETELQLWKNMQPALKNIATLVNDGAKYGASTQAKGCYKVGGRQMKILTPVIEKKIEWVSELELKVRQQTTEISSLKADAQKGAEDKIQLRQTLTENELLRKDLDGLQRELVLSEQRLQDALTELERGNTPLIEQRPTSRHVSIKLPEEVLISAPGKEGKKTEKEEGKNDERSEEKKKRKKGEKMQKEENVSRRGSPQDTSKSIHDVHVDSLTEVNSLPEVASLAVTKKIVSAVPIDDRQEPLEVMRENLKKKLSSRRSVLVPGSRVPSRALSTVSAMPSVRHTNTPQSIASGYDYDTESVSSHEHFVSVVKSEDPHSDELRLQIHALREELRQSDDRYYAQRAELENLREVIASNSAAAADQIMKEKQKKLEKQLEQLQQSEKLMKNELAENQTDLSSKQQYIELLQMQIKELLKEREMIKPGSQCTDLEKCVSPPNVNIPLSVDIAQLPRDQLIKKITQQSEVELHRLRKFIVREQQRFQANLRRANLESGKQVSKMKSEQAQLVREVNHFKQSIEQMVLKAEVGGDDLSHDQMSALIAISDGANILDGLSSLERKLHYIFLQKKMLMKHSNANKANAEKELEQCRLQLQKRTTECADQQQLVKRVENRNVVLARQCQQLSYLNDNLQRELEPCKAMVQKYAEIREKVDLLELNEKEQSNETKELTKSLEADRNRLKREVNHLAMSQICQLRQNTPNRLWSRLNSRQKGLLIEKAHTMNQINHMRRDEATDVLQYCNELILQRFADLVSRYMDLCKWNRIKTTIKTLAEKNHNNKRFAKYLETMEKRHSNTQQIWQKHCENVKVERDKAFLLLKQVLSDRLGDFLVPSIQLSKPNYPKPPK
eukprot:TCONS_00024116-protein